MPTCRIKAADAAACHNIMHADELNHNQSAPHFAAYRRETLEELFKKTKALLNDTVEYF